MRTPIDRKQDKWYAPSLNLLISYSRFFYLENKVNLKELPYKKNMTKTKLLLRFPLFAHCNHIVCWFPTYTKGRKWWTEVVVDCSNTVNYRYKNWPLGDVLSSGQYFEFTLRRYDATKTCPWNFFKVSWVVHFRKICKNQV